MNLLNWLGAGIDFPLNKIRLVAFLPFFTVAVGSTELLAHTVTFSGVMPAGSSYSIPTALSSDGTALTGIYYTADQQQRAFRWTRAGIRDLGTLGGTFVEPRAISADGDEIAGLCPLAGDVLYRSFRWTRNGLQDLGTLGGNPVNASAISADGSTIVGSAHTGTANHAFRWRNGVMQDLGAFGGDGSEAKAVSATGNVVAGSYLSATGEFFAYRWTPFHFQNLGALGGHPDVKAISWSGSVIVGNSDSGPFRWTPFGSQMLGSLGGSYTSAVAISRDGDVVVGSGFIEADAAQHAFRWKNNHMEDLGTLGGASSSARAVSPDGSIVVGDAQGDGSYKAFIWTPLTGMKDIGGLLVELGADLSGWELAAAHSIGVNNHSVTVAGVGIYNGQYSAWVATFSLYGWRND